MHVILLSRSKDESSDGEAQTVHHVWLHHVCAHVVQLGVSLS